jgi:chemosensory pili system protein ChpA (sensor histidine kinase/response regulator)
MITVIGDELEIDRTILDRLVAPLEHILRNAIAHGIENPSERNMQYKPEQGQLRLTIQREGSEMVLTMEDDGRGINVEKIKEKALALGLIQPYAIPSEDELIQLILSSGFSTADSVSQVAGRGVGMDVVHNEIRSLKGRLAIATEAGKGTTFTIRLPLTLSVILALLVKVNDESYAIPLNSVYAGERITVRDVKLMLGTHQPQYTYNGEHYDFMPLSVLLDKPLNLSANLKQQMPLLLFRSGDLRVALLVDQVFSNREIVIKSVGPQLGQISAITGATILGDGQVVFIIDIPTLMDIHGDTNLADHESHVLARELAEFEQKSLVAMVVDD